MADPVWHCTRQQAGPLVKECRAIRPRFGQADTREDRRAKQEIIRYAHSAVCRTQADRLELRLALFAFEGSHYTLTFDDPHLPKDFAGVRRVLRAYQARCKRWRHNVPYDWIYAIEGKHGDHRWHIHTVLRDSDFSPAEVRYLWRQGGVEDEPVLLKEGGYRRLAEYFNKESSDGIWIPIGRHSWSCSRALSQRVPPPVRWEDRSGCIEIPDNVVWSRRNQCENDFGAYYYGSYIRPKKEYFNLEDVARGRAHARLS